MSVSIRASEQTAGGFLDDVDVLLKSHAVVEYDYDGEVDPPVTGLMVTCQILGDADERKQFYSSGSKLVPGEDGVTFEPAEGSNAKGLNSKSKAGIYFKALEDAGFPEDKIENEVTCYDGMVVHMSARPAPSYGGLKDAKEGATISVVTEIKAFPWEKDKVRKLLAASGNGASPGKPSMPSKPQVAGKKAKPPVGEDEGEGDTVQDKAIQTILKALASPKYKKGIDRESLGQLVFKALSGDTDLKKVIKLINDDEWIGSDEAPWNYDADEDTISPA